MRVMWVPTRGDRRGVWGREWWPRLRRGGLRWVWLAVLAHAVVDGTTVFAQQVIPKGVGTSLLIEGIVALFGLAALWTIWTLRGAPKREAPKEQPAAQVAD